MKKNILGLAFVLLAHVSWTQSTYQFNVDLSSVVEDRLLVTATLPTIDKDSIEYHLPKIVPGTYHIYDFGRFINDFEVTDKEGNPLKIKQLTDNRFMIYDASKAAKLSYWVEDTYDTDKKNIIFEPAGTNFLEDKNFVLNTFGLIGYLDGMKNYPYEFTVKHPSKLYGSSALKKGILGEDIDQYFAENYNDLADGPIMYCEPDTANFKVGNADILVSVYSPNGKLKSSFVRSELEGLLAAQKEYLGGSLPVKNYAFIIYLFDSNPLSGYLGALEHSYSSFFCLPEADPVQLARVIKDVAAHEFFHIVTPLNIHSEEIGSFDYINPKMSKHLWLYEGVTEYASGLTQVKYGQMIKDDYLDVLLGKIRNSKSYKDDLPFTELSLKCLKETKDQYGNVYEKGALIGMALDIELRYLSNGEYGIQDLLNDLSKEYGKYTSFKDDELFDKIVALTYPEIATFFERYVAGSESLPLVASFEKVGIDFSDRTKVEVIDIDDFELDWDEQNENLMVGQSINDNSFALNLGLQEGDIVLKIDGTKLTESNHADELKKMENNKNVDDEVIAIVKRADENGKLKKLKLTATLEGKQKTVYEKIAWKENPSEQQLAIRKSWINK